MRSRYAGTPYCRQNQNPNHDPNSPSRPPCLKKSTSSSATAAARRTAGAAPERLPRGCWSAADAMASESPAWKLARVAECLTVTGRSGRLSEWRGGEGAVGGMVAVGTVADESRIGATRKPAPRPGARLSRRPCSSALGKPLERRLGLESADSEPCNCSAAATKRCSGAQAESESGRITTTDSGECWAEVAEAEGAGAGADADAGAGALAAIILANECLWSCPAGVVALLRIYTQ